MQRLQIIQCIVQPVCFAIQRHRISINDRQPNQAYCWADSVYFPGSQGLAQIQPHCIQHCMYYITSMQKECQVTCLYKSCPIDILGTIVECNQNATSWLLLTMTCIIFTLMFALATPSLTSYYSLFYARLHSRFIPARCVEKISQTFSFDLT